MIYPAIVDGCTINLSDDSICHRLHSTKASLAS